MSVWKYPNRWSNKFERFLKLSAKKNNDVYFSSISWQEKKVILLAGCKQRALFLATANKSHHFFWSVIFEILKCNFTAGQSQGLVQSVCSKDVFVPMVPSPLALTSPTRMVKHTLAKITAIQVDSLMFPNSSSVGFCCLFAKVTNLTRLRFGVY